MTDAVSQPGSVMKSVGILKKRILFSLFKGPTTQNKSAFCETKLAFS